MSKKYDIAVKVGEYEKNGETKSKYENIGVMLKGEHGPYILLKRTFNPAGVPNPNNRDTVLISLFEPKEKQSNPEDEDF